MKIMSWNVNQFCGMGSWSKFDKNGNPNCDYVEPTDRIPYMYYVILFVKEFLSENKDNIVFLQEVPGIKKQLFGEFKSLFSLEKYNFFDPQIENSNHITISINNKNSIWIENSDYYNQCKKFQEENDNKDISNSSFFKNRYIETSYKLNETDNLRILGVHMPIDDKDTLDANKLIFWDQLISYSKNKSNQIIIGDFNAGNYKKNSFENNIQHLNFITYKDRYLNFLKCGYNDILNSKIVSTKFNTPIDHILTTNKIITNAKVLNSINLSDHYPIIAEIDLSNIKED